MATDNFIRALTVLKDDPEVPASLIRFCESCIQLSIEDDLAVAAGLVEDEREDWSQEDYLYYGAVPDDQSN